MENSGIREVLRNNPAIIDELGDNLYSMLKRIASPKGTDMVAQFTPQLCTEFIRYLTINNEFFKHKSVIYDNLAVHFPDVRFIESDPELDHAGDIDFLGWVGEKAFGVQIKPITAKANFGNYSPSERMRASFDEFSQQYGGTVFIVYSVDDAISNKEVIEEIAKEIKRLQQ